MKVGRSLALRAGAPKGLFCSFQDFTDALVPSSAHRDFSPSNDAFPSRFFFLRFACFARS